MIHGARVSRLNDGRIGPGRFVLYNPRYDPFESLPAWCRATLDGHEWDPRPYRFLNQEPGTSSEIKTFCSLKYKTSFPRPRCIGG